MHDATIWIQWLGRTMKNLQLKLLQKTLEKARFGVCVLDASRRFIYVNGAFASKFDVRIEDLLGFSYLSLHPQLGHLPNFHELFGSKNPDAQEHCLFRSRSGESRHLRLQSGLLEEEGESFRMMSVVDLSDYTATATTKRITG